MLGRHRKRAGGNRPRPPPSSPSLHRRQRRSLPNRRRRRFPPYPYEAADLGGRNFTFLNVADNLWQGTFHVLDYEEESGEPVNDALFRRARGTEEGFGK